MSLNVESVVARMIELGLVSEKGTELGVSEVVKLVGIDETREIVPVHVAQAAMSTVGEGIKMALLRSAPVIGRTARVAGDAAAITGSFVFEVTRSAVNRLSGPIYGPACPDCGERTVIKRNRRTGIPFAACSSWDDTGCGFTARIRFTDKQ